MTLSKEWNDNYSTIHQFSLKQYQHSARSGIAIIAQVHNYHTTKHQRQQHSPTPMMHQQQEPRRGTQQRSNVQRDIHSINSE